MTYIDFLDAGALLLVYLAFISGLATLMASTLKRPAVQYICSIQFAALLGAGFGCDVAARLIVLFR